MSESDVAEDDRVFRPFTRDSLAAIEARIAVEEEQKANQPEKVNDDEDDELDAPQPDQQLEAGASLPLYLQHRFPPELSATPIEDIDKFYQNKRTFVVISKGKDIFRFSAHKALFCMDPFNPVRRVAIYILVHPIFSMIVILTILVNCVLMTMKDNPNVEASEPIFTAIYTFESCIKILARGFIMDDFTYLRDAWNWLDFIVITLAYITMGIDLGNLSVLRTFRVLRALKTVAIVPGLKTIVGAVMESVKNLKDVIILTIFSLSVFALLGLQIYMGILTQKCIKIFPVDEYGNYSEQTIKEFRLNKSHWHYRDGEPEPLVCGNNTGATTCPEGYLCYQGYGPNPNYGYTSFDSFGWALLSSFRLMTQDFWENLYQLVLRAAGPWHMVFFVFIIFLGSFYLVNLILAIVAMSYDELQKRAELEAQEEAEALRLLEEEQQRRDGTGEELSPSVTSSNDELFVGQEKGTENESKPADKMSIQSEGDESFPDNKGRPNGNVRKGSMSLPGSPFNLRRGSRGSHQFSWRPNGRRYGDKKPLVLSTFLDAQEHLPYADDSNAVTPMSEENGAIIIPVYTSLNSRHGSYTSHGSRVSYTSHGDMNDKVLTKETQLRSRRNMPSLVPEVYIDSKPPDFSDSLEDEKLDYISQRLVGLQANIDYIDKDARPLSLLPRPSVFSANYAEESSIDSEDFLSKHKYPDNPFVDQVQTKPVLDMKDVMVLNDIIEQAAGRHSRASEHGDEEEEGPTWKERCMAGCLKCIDIFCVWNCCACWVKFQELLCLLVYDAFVELFITLCIVVNTLFMAMDHHGMDKSMEHFLQMGNYFFTATFAIEAGLKLLAISPKNYFQEGWNIFDFIIVCLSLLELCLENVSGLSILRSFRLLRVFKLAKSWPTLNLLISIMGKTMGALGNLTFVLGIIIFIFAVMGMQLFGKNYELCKTKFHDHLIPRWHFIDFMHSFMIVFRVLCGEWIESMWDCMLVSGWSCVPFFLATVVIGNLVVLNLFLALLLSSFGTSNLSQAPTADNETNKLAEAVDRINRFTAWVKRLFMGAVKAIRSKVTNQIADQTTDAREVDMEDAPAEVLVDGQILMRDKKSPKEQTALEVALNEVVEINLHGDVAKLKNRKKDGEIIQNSKPICNSIKRIDDNKEREHMENHLAYKKSDDSVSYRSSSSVKDKKTVSSVGGSRRSSMASVSEGGEEKKDLSKEDLEKGGEEGDEQLEDQEVGEEGAMEHEDAHGEDHEEELKTPVLCYPECCYKLIPWCAGKDTPFWDGWYNLRHKTLLLIENKYFETLVIVCILISSLALAVEDRYIKEKPLLELILFYMDRVFTVVFFIEMLVKWLALGFRRYFTNAWCWLDFIIVLLSLINLAATAAGASNFSAFRSMRTLRALRPLRAVSRWEGMRLSLLNLGAGLVGAGNIPAFKSMRTLRALRPLRALSRMQGMRVVVNALVQAIPSIMNVLLVCLIFWLIFSIMGVQMFGGKYYKCLDHEGVTADAKDVPNKNSCLAWNYTWENSPINFDNVGNGYLALFQVATFKGWIDIMNDAIDSRNDTDLQPVYEININMYLFFVFFIIFGSFFTLNLFIGVIIDNFNEQKKKAGGSLEMFMTEDQKKYYNAMKKMGSKKPAKAIPRPRFRPQAIVFDITMDKKFDMTIMIFIGFNMVVMSMDHYDMSPEMTFILNNLNIVFIAIFATECSLKIFALRWFYFKEPWNMFDFVVVILSIMGIMLKDLIEKYFVSPTLLRVVRVVKVGRVLRLVKGAKGIRTLLFALAMSLPALFNICLLLFLVMFIYAIFGMSFFKNVKYSHGLDETFNFGTFGQSMIILFQMSTSAGWDGVLLPLMNEENCTQASADGEDEGNCGSSGKAVVFLISYLVISFLIVINMYIAVILENYSQATEEVQEGLTDDDYDMYYEIWQKVDPEGTQYIKYEVLTDFLDELEQPLQIHKPNKYKIISMDIPICKGDLLYCVDILDALTKDFFARKGNPVEEAADLGDVMKADRPGYEVISSTLWRQREEFCARLIQKAWRRHRGKAHGDHESSVVTQEAGHDHDAGSDAQQQQTSIVIESDGHVTKNGHKVVLHSRSPSVTSRSTDV